MIFNHDRKALEAIERMERQQNRLLYEILGEAQRTNRLLHRLLGEVEESRTTITITQIGDIMQTFDPGATGIVLQAAFTPSGATAPSAGFTAAWTDSNGFATFAPDASDASGLTQDVTLSAAAVVGQAGTITCAVTGTFPDGTAASLTGTFPYTVGPSPVSNASGVGITQIA